MIDNPPKLVDFLEAYVLQLVQREGSPVCHVEKFIEGEYRKHNNNSGWVDTEDLRNTPQAFAHFTYEASKGKLLVVDIQGVNDVYTDPQIHTTENVKSFGKGNLGQKGIDKFLSTHRCNKICHYLKLNNVSQLPVRPEGTLPAATVIPLIFIFHYHIHIHTYICAYMHISARITLCICVVFVYKSSDKAISQQLCLKSNISLKCHCWSSPNNGEAFVANHVPFCKCWVNFGVIKFVLFLNCVPSFFFKKWSNVSSFLHKCKKKKNENTFNLTSLLLFLVFSLIVKKNENQLVILFCFSDKKSSSV
ncbi:hypothetical protein RFI_21073 [Reticulomyxa filosa]|uniref:Alpha-type protein kinase domain-containing protein n=1 Tax=Reticulomyxa filosa TaxID=46433 RepID=X6MRJ1_RETFI|nr:hypothetical protein RFI_21073 [Reticulomyxa filosa]|eukprot:ETO16281.1 hypothetical protein RFI_21073 [Reticulomyxa filosa]